MILDFWIKQTIIKIAKIDLIPKIMSNIKQNSSQSLRENQTKNFPSQIFQKRTQNIDFIIRPIIQQTQSNIEKQFRDLHNKFLLQGFKRKVNCYQKFIHSSNQNFNRSIEKQQNSKEETKAITKAHLPRQQISESDKILEYYKCFDQQLNIANIRYNKIYKKSQESKVKLINCVQDCSGKSKEQNQLFQKCRQSCKQTYAQIIEKIYKNFYTKFITKE